MGGSSSARKGGRTERELVNALHEQGFGVMPAPASGSATPRELPDVLAGRPLGGKGDVSASFAIEAKSSSGDPIYLSGEEVGSLFDFATAFGAKVRIGVRFNEEYGDPSYGEDWPGWYFFHPRQLHQTDGGNYRVKKGKALEEGTPITDL